MKYHRSILIASFALIAFTALSVPLLLSAQESTTIDSDVPPAIRALPDVPCVLSEPTACAVINDPAQITELPHLFLYFYNFGFWIIGFALLVTLVWAGVTWILAGPNLARVSQAKSHITNVILGFILLLSSWLILNTINPDLINSAFQLRPLPGFQITVPGEVGQPPGVVDPEEEGVPLVICSGVGSCGNYEDEANCIQNSCSVGGSEGQGCQWDGSSCIEADVPTNGGGGSCGVNFPLSVCTCDCADDGDCENDSVTYNYVDPVINAQRRVADRRCSGNVGLECDDLGPHGLGVLEGASGGFIPRNSATTYMDALVAEINNSTSLTADYKFFGDEPILAVNDGSRVETYDVITSTGNVWNNEGKTVCTEPVF